MRLTKITTKTGDDGNCCLADGRRVSKTSNIMVALGTIDELNCTIGLIYPTTSAGSSNFGDLTRIQHILFDIGAELSSYKTIITEEDVEWIEERIESINSKLEPLENFILPAGCERVVRIHFSRAVARRAERCLIAAAPDDHTYLKSVNTHKQAKIFMNRLSDYLFVLARAYSKGNEWIWTPKPEPDGGED